MIKRSNDLRLINRSKFDQPEQSEPITIISKVTNHHQSIKLTISRISCRFQLPSRNISSWLPVISLCFCKCQKKNNITNTEIMPFVDVAYQFRACVTAQGYIFPTTTRIPPLDIFAKSVVKNFYFLPISRAHFWIFLD